MAERRDPLQRVVDDEDALDGVVFWSGEGHLDSLSRALHRVGSVGGRVLLVFLAGVVVTGHVALTVAAAAAAPIAGVYILLSMMPALALAAYVWRLDVTRRQPLAGLGVTFLLGVLFAGFAAEINGAFQWGFELAGLGGSPLGLVLFFYLVVGPVEETVKLLAVRLSSYRTPAFGAVVDGAVYGAVAGLGFATIENAVYIAGNVFEVRPGGSVAVETFRIAAVRSFAGPGHVIYSAFAGYYLGLAKFNPENRGAIVVKGLLVAALVHATYNVSVTFLPVVGLFVPGFAALGDGALFIGFVLTYDGVLGYFLYRKLDRYRAAYEAHGVGVDPDPETFPVARTEYDPPTGE